MATTWDYIIVGAGSAGCIVAHRLAESGRHSVLVLDAGAGVWDRTPLINMPAAALYLAGNSMFDWRYPTQADGSCNGRTDPLYNGRVLGGGSSINGEVFIRGCPDDFDQWARQGNSGWSYREVLPYFKKMERTEIGSDEYHGRDGRVGVEYASPMLDVSHRFIEAASESGVPYNSDINGMSMEGISRTPCNIYRGVRQSAARVYLRPAMKGSNIMVKTRASVQKVIFEGTDAVGVEYRYRGRTHMERATKEIVLCAGAVRSPHILMLSGIGPASELNRFGIHIICDLPGVGQNYMDHAAAHMVYSVGLPTWCSESSLSKQVRHSVRWLWRKDGPAQTGFSQAVAFLSSGAQREPDIQLSFVPLALSAERSVATSAGAWRRFTKEHGDMVMVYVNECRPMSRGCVKLASPSPLDSPSVYPNLLGSRRSIDTLIAGITTVRRIMQAGAIQRYVRGELRPGPEELTAGGLERWFRANVSTMAHASGTCAMGRDEAAVVDEKLRVVGVNRLRVADASVMPAITSGNINAPTMMIGERAAALILDDANCGIEQLE